MDYIDPLGLVDCDQGGVDAAEAVEGEEARIDDAPEMQEMALGSPRDRIPEAQNAVSSEANNCTKDPYLKIVSNSPLPKK